MRPMLIVSPAAVPARDLPLGLSGFEAAMLLAPAGWVDLPLALLSSLGTVVELPSDPEVTPEVLSRCRDFRPSGVTVVSDQTIPFAIALAEALELPILGQVAPLTDKVAQRDMLREVDATRCLPVSDTSDWDAVVAELGTPLVLKPVEGRGSRNTFVVTSAEEAREMTSSLWEEAPGEKLAAEEFLPGRVCGPFGSFISVESLVVDGRVTHFGVTGKLPQLAPFRETSHSFPAPLGEDERCQVEDLARHAIKAVGVRNGATHTEIKLTPYGPRVLEVNGRLGGYINEIYGRVPGVDVVDLAIRASCGQLVVPPEPDSDRVFFQYSHQPPRGATRLLDVSGVREVRKIEGVTRYDPLIRTGSVLPDDSRSWDLNLVCGDAGNYDAMLARLDEVHRCLVFRFLRHGEEVTLNGRELADQPTSEPSPVGLRR